MSLWSPAATLAARRGLALQRAAAAATPLRMRTAAASWAKLASASCRNRSSFTSTPTPCGGALFADCRAAHRGMATTTAPSPAAAAESAKKQQQQQPEEAQPVVSAANPNIQTHQPQAKEEQQKQQKEQSQEQEEEQEQQKEQAEQEQDQQQGPGILRRAFRGVVRLGLLSGVVLFVVYSQDVRAGVHRCITMPLMRLLVEPEDAHKLAIRAAQVGLTPRDRVRDDPVLATRLFGRDLANPIGLAAGFDKNGEAMDAMLAMGFGAVEIGSVTPKPQPGNPKPRVFRLGPDGAIINRYGFNSDGHAEVLERLLHRERRHVYRHGDALLAAGAAASAEGEGKTGEGGGEVWHSLVPRKLLGVNLGKNKSSPADSHDDYVRGVHAFAPVADYLVVNVSSPNTPGLRQLQRQDALRALVQQVQAARDAARPGLPVCIKVAPDLSPDELRAVASVARECRVDAVVVSNTTVQRPPSLRSHADLVDQPGGLSGAPLRPLGIRAVREMHALLAPAGIPIIGCGGIATADDAIAYARAGATVVQLYTSLAMNGPYVVADIKDGVAQYLRARGLTWMDIVGKPDDGAGKLAATPAAAGTGSASSA